MIVRRKTEADREAILAIARSLPEWFTPAALDHIHVDDGFQDGLVAVDDAGQVVGFLLFFVYEGMGNIAWIGVQPELQRKGIGRALLERFEQDMKAAGVKELQVYTLGDSVDYEPYARTRAFYAAVGFSNYRSVALDNPECPDQLYLRKQIES